MPWVRFERDYCWSPPQHKGHVTIAYKAGSVKLIPTPAANAAIDAGAAKRTSNPRRVEIVEEDDAAHG